MSKRNIFSSEISRELANELRSIYESSTPQNDNFLRANRVSKSGLLFLIIFACTFIWYIGKPSSGMVVALSLLAILQSYATILRITD